MGRNADYHGIGGQPVSVKLEVQTRKSYPDKVTVDFALIVGEERFNITLLESNFIELLSVVGGDLTEYVTNQITPLNTLTNTLGIKTGAATVL